METVPSLPTGTITRFGTVWAGAKLRFEAKGWACPPGHTVTKLEPTVSVTVTFSVTVLAFGGTPATPATRRLRAVHDDHGVAYPPVPSRESRTRTGVTAVNDEAVPAVK